MLANIVNDQQEITMVIDGVTDLGTSNFVQDVQIEYHFEGIEIGDFSSIQGNEFFGRPYDDAKCTEEWLDAQVDPFRHGQAAIHAYEATAQNDRNLLLGFINGEPGTVLKRIYLKRTTQLDFFIGSFPSNAGDSTLGLRIENAAALSSLFYITPDMYAWGNFGLARFLTSDADNNTKGDTSIVRLEGGKLFRNSWSTRVLPRVPDTDGVFQLGPMHSPDFFCGTEESGADVGDINVYLINDNNTGHRIGTQDFQFNPGLENISGAGDPGEGQALSDDMETVTEYPAEFHMSGLYAPPPLSEGNFTVTLQVHFFDVKGNYISSSGLVINESESLPAGGAQNLYKYSAPAPAVPDRAYFFRVGHTNLGAFQIVPYQEKLRAGFGSPLVRYYRPGLSCWPAVVRVIEPG